MTAYYNEFDPKAAAWLRELIKQGHIAEGVVDERSIVDVRPEHLVGYDQCHFFAGIGVWSHALRTAGWPDDRPVWTGSCPCQPFSAAGKRGGTDDHRHLWPEFFRLIAECRPVTVFGEQVASKDGLAWLGAVYADLEGAGYAVGAVDTCAAGFGAPHIRQRLYFCGERMDDSCGGRRQHEQTKPRSDGTVRSQRETECVVCSGGAFNELADAERGTAERHRQSVGGETRGDQGIGKTREGAQRIRDDVGDGVDSRLLANNNNEGLERYGGSREKPISEGWEGEERHDSESRNASELAYSNGGNASAEGLQRGGKHGQQPEDRGPCNGFWSDAEWISCRDGKQRPVEPGPVEMVDGLAGELGLVRLVSYPDRPHEERIIYSPLIQKGKARVMRLRGYGNAIVAPQAVAFVEAYMEVCG